MGIFSIAAEGLGLGRRRRSRALHEAAGCEAAVISAGSGSVDEEAASRLGLGLERRDAGAHPAGQLAHSVAHVAAHLAGLDPQLVADLGRLGAQPVAELLVPLASVRLLLDGVELAEDDGMG